MRAGFSPWCVDLFADRDLRAMAPVHRCAPDRYPDAMLELLDVAPAGPVLLTGALENYTQFLDDVGQRRQLLGSTADAIRAVRSPTALCQISPIEGLRLPQVRDRNLSPSDQADGERDATPRWLIKPCRSAGGMGIHPWLDGRDSIPPEHILQEYIAGTSISAVFAADRDRARLLGVTRQIIGESVFGVADFRYCGSIGPMALESAQEVALAHLGASLARIFDLRGIFGVDAIIDNHRRVCPVEVNPRYTASVEVLERFTHGAFLGPLDKILDALITGSAMACHGKAILFTKRDVHVSDLGNDVHADCLADVPKVGAHIKAGAPICTIFASGSDHASCLARLCDLASKLYAVLGQ